MNLTKELDAIFLSSAHGNDSPTTLFWKLIDVTREMAKRIEVLARKLDADARAKGYAHTIFHR